MGSSGTGAPNAGGAYENCFFRPVEKFQVQTPYRRIFVSIPGPSATVVRIYGGALAVSSTTLVVVEVS